ncbi:extracellular solute-binding protein [Jingyaoa shaoxingensis]|uniref:Extracellular solute-binding protein n=1 Tax=Jingyaoa shaoxingensis TaxID=2763671 RepID=A0ABR7N9F5_9FIRM|nr:extracellular solute-binding protein [Jingyaoa shaoxingensis]MBC8573033.1 extracellular solute-binding protein [Jingyaoa shaoxingensis]
MKKSLIALGMTGTMILAGTSMVMAEDKPYDGTNLVFWMQAYGSDPSIQRAALDKVTADFQEQTGISVEYNIVDWGSASQKLTLACTGGEAPDVADIFFTKSLATMSSDEYGLMELNDLVEEMGGEDTWITAGKDEACVDGDWYGIPWRADTRVLLYNTEDFENAGITEAPTTWDELVEDAQKLTVTDEDGNITHAGLAWYSDMGRYDQTWFSMLAQCGGTLMNDEFTEFTLDTEQSKQALAFLSDCINTYNICSNSLDASYDAVTEFMSGNVSMVFGVTGETKNNILQNAPQMEGKFASAPLPTATGAENEKNGISFSAPIGIFKTTENADAAKEWVKYFCSEDVQLYMSQELGLLNSNCAVMENSYFTEDDWLKAFSTTIANSQSGDMPLTTWSQIDAWPDGPIPSMCANVVNGTDADTAIAECLSQIEAIGF